MANMNIIGEENGINGRVGDLERQILMFEQMLLTLSGTLDQHFKKYDMVISTQQQQISDLNAIISTLLNDQFRHSEITREKLFSALHGISATSVSVTNTINDSSLRVTNGNGSLTIGGENDKNDTTNTDSNASVSANPLSTTNAAANSSANPAVNPTVTNNNTHNTNNTNNGNTSRNNSVNKESNRLDVNSILQSSNSQTSALNTTASLTTKTIQPGNPSNLNNSNILNGAAKNLIPTPFPTNTATLTASDNVASSNVVLTPESSTSNLNHPNPNGNIYTYKQSQNNTSQPLQELSDYNSNLIKQRKKKKKVFVGEFQFLKSPHSILDLWKEYTEGINGQPSIKELESIYQTGWRRDPAVNKRFSRRKVLYRAIENGLNRGYTLEYIIDLLEDYRYIDRNKNQKRPIGWIFHSTNIPDLLK